MARWNIVPSAWDELSGHDRAFMMAFLNTEADLANAVQRTSKKRGAFVVSLGAEDGD